MQETITITVRRDDLEAALNGLGFACQNYCISSDRCDCGDIADRLEAAATEAPE